jgi:hypothetical protein
LARRFGSLAVFFVTLFASAAPAGAAPVPADLNTWVVFNQPNPGLATPSDGDWQVNAAGNAVVEKINGKPTFFVAPHDADDFRITTTFTTPGTDDDDFFGLALGFPTDPTATGAEYLLIDWKQGDQHIDWWDGTGPADGKAGLAVSKVTGLPTLNELWGHFDSSGNPGGGVTELARGTTLGMVGWSPSTSYQFDVEYTTTSLKVWVDGALQISINGSFPSGRFALYDFSQPQMSFSAVTFERLNDPPTVIGGGAPDRAVDEGSTATNSGAFGDPDGDTLTLSCAGPCSGFVDNGDGTWQWSKAAPDGPTSFGVTISASDGSLQVSDQFTVVVANVAPVITTTSGVPSVNPMDTLLDVSADFTDAGVLDTHTATFSWGDGTTSPGDVGETSGSGNATGQHHYTGPGIFTVTVEVCDKDGACDTATIGEVFVFDPNTFVTGGGWVNSPQGASVDDATHSGKGTFGFVARYDRSGTVRGNLQFQLHKGISLHATSFDYLLINDGIAVFEGEGTVNGTSGYEFAVVATDERDASSSEDLFRIEIKGPSGTIYGLAAGLPVRGKGVQVHTKK